MFNQLDTEGCSFIFSERSFGNKGVPTTGRGFTKGKLLNLDSGSVTTSLHSTKARTIDQECAKPKSKAIVPYE